MKEKTLTGNYYHKKTWLGLVLMVEEKWTQQVNCGLYLYKSESVTQYRKAKEVDLKHITL